MRKLAQLRRLSFQPQVQNTIKKLENLKKISDLETSFNYLGFLIKGLPFLQQEELPCLVPAAAAVPENRNGN
mgnify:CR=1 FL=1